jgi:hypothetical protein
MYTDDLETFILPQEREEDSAANNFCIFVQTIVNEQFSDYCKG